jgi:hypothetical protein
LSFRSAAGGVNDLCFVTDVPSHFALNGRSKHLLSSYSKEFWQSIIRRDIDEFQSRRDVFSGRVGILLRGRRAFRK